MKASFSSQFAADLVAFLAFKRARGYRYQRAEFMLRSFDRFVLGARQDVRAVNLEVAIISWLGSRPQRKPISIAMDLSVMREFWRFGHRRDPRRFAREPRWPRLPTEPEFVARVLTPSEIRMLLHRIRQLDRPRFRSALYRALFLVLYCTGVRFGEALRIRIRDIDLPRGVIFIDDFKGRSRWTPFHPSLGVELGLYLRARLKYVGAPAQPDDRIFVGTNGRTLSTSAAGYTLCKLFRTASLKPERGRSGPRPYDLRHTFAVHRLTRWYREGVDLHERLPWLSAYLGHVDLLGTETYLNATPELLALAADKHRRRYHGHRSAR